MGYWACSVACCVGLRANLGWESKSGGLVQLCIMLWLGHRISRSGLGGIPRLVRMAHPPPTRQRGWQRSDQVFNLGVDKAAETGNLFERAVETTAERASQFQTLCGGESLDR